MEELKDLLRQTAQDMGEPGYDTAYGWGVLHTGLLMAALLEDTAWQASIRGESPVDGPDSGTPEDGENPAPEDGETPAPEDGENPAPEDGETPAPEDGENPAPEDGENPAPENRPYAVNSVSLEGKTATVEIENRFGDGAVLMALAYGENGQFLCAVMEDVDTSRVAKGTSESVSVKLDTVSPGTVRAFLVENGTLRLLSSYVSLEIPQPQVPDGEDTV